MNYLITVVGPTAIGKTALSIRLAQYFNSEIISCDSRQFFKEMTLGTAVPDPEELTAVPHHFIQNKSIRENYSVGDFERDALEKSNKLFTKHNVVVMVGGSGLYVDAVLDGLDNFPKIDPAVRAALNARLEKEGLPNLQNQLKGLDPKTYQTIAIDNPHRVMRALEICIGSGRTYSSFKNKPKTPRNFTAIKVGLTASREIIYDRINQRVDIMMSKGLLNEAQKLYPLKHLNALQTVGYRELFDYFDEKTTLEFAVSEIKKNSRRFAKRQLTWFKKDENIAWFDYLSDTTKIINHIKQQITKTT